MKWNEIKEKEILFDEMNAMKWVLLPDSEFKSVKLNSISGNILGMQCTS